jgi:hypothetical protein
MSARGGMRYHVILIYLFNVEVTAPTDIEFFHYAQVQKCFRSTTFHNRRPNGFIAFLIDVMQKRSPKAIHKHVSTMILAH